MKLDLRLKSDKSSDIAQDGESTHWISDRSRCERAVIQPARTGLFAHIKSVAMNGGLNGIGTAACTIM